MNPFGQTKSLVFDRSRSHISELQIRISQLRTGILRLRLEVLDMEFSDYGWAKKSSYETKICDPSRENPGPVRGTNRDPSTV